MSGFWNPSACLAILLLSATLLPSASAQDLNAAVQERAKLIQDVQALLNSENAAIRMATFEEVMKGDDPLIRSMAMEAALGSSDDRLQTAALRLLIKERSLLNVQLEIPTDREKEEIEDFEYYWSPLSLTRLALADTPSEFTLYYNDRPAAGTFRRGGLDADLGRCRMSMNIANGTTLVGTLDCSGYEPWPAVIRLD